MYNRLGNASQYAKTNKNNNKYLIKHHPEA